MIEDFKIKLNSISEKIQNAYHTTSLEREINKGESINQYFNERSKELSDLKGELFWAIKELQMLMVEMKMYNDKFISALENPHTKEMWETIQIAMALVK